MSAEIPPAATTACHQRMTCPDGATSRGYLRSCAYRDLSSGEQMNRRVGIWLALLAVVSCRSYDYKSRLTAQGGLVPPDQFARYGKEQAEEVAIAREYGRADQGDTPEALVRQANAAIAYARTLPDVADVSADPLGYRLTVRF